MNTSITKYNCICNLGRNIEEVYNNAVNGISDRFSLISDIVKDKVLYIAETEDNDIVIDDLDYNLKCNRLILECLSPVKSYIEKLIEKHGREKIGIVIATTNSGVEEFEHSNREVHSQIGNPAIFLKKHLGLRGYAASVSTACTSGIKAFSTARNLIKNNVSEAVIVCGVDTLAKVPLYGFNALEILSPLRSNPLSKNRKGINIGEGCSIFILEKEGGGIDILGIGETSDTYHSTTPDPDAKEAIKAIEFALNDAGLTPDNIDYINLHGTGTISNDLMEAKAVNKFFKNTYASSTKPLTGHCLGAAGCIETALCCALIDKGGYYPHIYDGEYDNSLPELNISKPPRKTNICMNNAFGFGGSNAIIILGRKND